MAKMTLLEIVQDIANDLDTDEINSIEATVESIQIAQIVKTTYFELIANRNWPHLRKTSRINGLADVNTPTHLQVPSDVKEITYFSYNKRSESDPTRDKFEEVEYLYPDDFLRRTNSRNVNNSNVDRITELGGSYIYILNDRHPQYYTSFDDDYIVCDSYNSNLEATLQSSNTQIIAYVDPTWTHDDSFTPDLPSEAFPLLLEESKSTASLVIRQMANEKSEQKSRRQNRWLARKDWKVKGGVRYPDYGRKTVGYTYSHNMFEKDD